MNPEQLSIAVELIENLEYALGSGERKRRVIYEVRRSDIYTVPADIEFEIYFGSEVFGTVTTLDEVKVFIKAILAINGLDFNDED